MAKGIIKYSIQNGYIDYNVIINGTVEKIGVIVGAQKRYLVKIFGKDYKYIYCK